MVDFLLAGIFLASFFLGIKHSLDVDHVAAVSSLLLKSPKLTYTIKMAIIWSLGHTFTAGILTIILFLMKDVFLTSFLAWFELIIAILLILIGTITIIFETNKIRAIKKPHSHHFHFFKKNRLHFFDKNRHPSHSTTINGQDGNEILKPEPKGKFHINNNFVAPSLFFI